MGDVLIVKNKTNSILYDITCVAKNPNGKEFRSNVIQVLKPAEFVEIGWLENAPIANGATVRIYAKGYLMAFRGNIPYKRP